MSILRTDPFIKLVAILFLTAALAFSFYSEDAPVSSDVILLKRLCFEDILVVLQNDLGIKIAFAETPYADSPKLSNRQQLDKFQVIAPMERTKKEKAWMELLESLLQQHPSSADAVYAEQPRFTVEVPKKISTTTDVKNLLERIAALDARYILNVSDTIYILSDTKSIVNVDRISLKLQNANLGDALDQLAKALVKENIGLSEPLPEQYNNVKITLNLENVILAEALSRFAEALGPKMTWTLLEGSNGGSLSFGEVRMSPHPWNNPLLY